MIFSLNNFGFKQPFQVTQSDGITPVDLTALTVTWLFKDNTVIPATTKSITGTVANGLQGLVNFIVPAGFFTVITKYDCTLELSSGALTEDTYPLFIVEIVAQEK